MKILKKMLFVGSVCLLSFLDAYEPSIYGAGDIESETPYGLTQTEQTVLENKKALQRLYNKITEQQRKIDGLTTIIEGQNREILDFKEQLEAQSKTLEVAMQPNEEDKKTYALLMEMGKSIDFINSTYVSRDELATLEQNRANTIATTSLGSPVASNSIAGNSADVYRKGVQLFGRKSYNAAKSYFEQAVAENFKPAASNYYLGEISYYTHSYEDAVSYYKQSASLYDSAGYMDVLYLHTAIALDKTGQREQAKAFFQHVVDNYPNGRAAQIAKRRL